MKIKIKIVFKGLKLFLIKFIIIKNIFKLKTFIPNYNIFNTLDDVMQVKIWLQ